MNRKRPRNDDDNLIRRLNNAYIEIFKNNYEKTKGEKSRNAFTSTSVQGSMSIREPNDNDVINFFKGINDTKPPPYIINFEEFNRYLEKMWKKM